MHAESRFTHSSPPGHPAVPIPHPPVGMHSPGTPGARQPAGDSARLASVLDLLVGKSRSNIRRLADEPKAAAHAADGNYFDWEEGFFEIGNWTSSFHTGMALYAYGLTREDYFLAQLERLAPFYHRKVHTHAMDTMHDLGFLYSLYSVELHRITGAAHHRDTALRAATVLADRFNPRAGFIRAWGRLDDHDSRFAGFAIIDCMMNLPLLFWAYQQTGDRRFNDVADAHANSTLQRFVRPDGSVCHACRFDPVTGAFIAADNYCGFATESHWARGAAWALYGFALAHRYTKDSRYLEAAERIANKYVESLDHETIPVWDFRLPPGEPIVRDSSAAAVAVCGLQELLRLGSDTPRFRAARERLLARLCAPDYIDERPEVPGVLRDGQTGQEGGGAVNRYTSWGDYYLMEALASHLHGARVPW